MKNIPPDIRNHPNYQEFRKIKILNFCEVILNAKLPDGDALGRNEHGSPHFHIIIDSVKYKFVLPTIEEYENSVDKMQLFKDLNNYLNTKQSKNCADDINLQILKIIIQSYNTCDYSVLKQII